MFTLLDAAILAAAVPVGLLGPTLLRSLRSRRAAPAVVPARLVEVPAPRRSAAESAEQPVRVAA